MSDHSLFRWPSMAKVRPWVKAGEGRIVDWRIIVGGGVLGLASSEKQLP